MSSRGRAPWWYSGEDEQPEVEQPEVEQPRARPSEPELRPEPAGEAAPDSEPDGTASTMDWTALVAGAAKMVDWATERVMAPHAEHTDPADHPECMVCRTVTLIGDPVGLMGGGPRPAEETEPESADIASAAPVSTPGAQPIRWIPIVESGN